MLFLVLFLAVIFAGCFYLLAFANGLARKRWALAGFLFGPFVWPMFCVEKRMKSQGLLSRTSLILKA